MRLHHFFVDTPLREGATQHLTDAGLVHQLKQVFRYRAGDKIVLLDNTGFQYVSEISLITKEEVVVVVGNKEKNTVEPCLKVHVYMSLIKKDHFEWVLEKATELGVSEITPVISERTEKKDFNEERAIKILREASEQSGRGILPIFHETVTLEGVCTQISGDTNPKVALHFSNTLLTKEEFSNSEALSLFIGPEGGWGEKDFEIFKKYDIAMRGMGMQTLRAETAAVAGLSVVLI